MAPSIALVQHYYKVFERLRQLEQQPATKSCLSLKSLYQYMPKQKPSDEQKKAAIKKSPLNSSPAIRPDPAASPSA
jgi:hypothetical protein